MPSSSNFLNNSQIRKRMLSQILFVFGAMFLILTARLFYLQIIKGDFHRSLSLKNMMNLKTIKAPRGRIFDREGRLIVRNRASYSIMLYPYKIKNKEYIFDNLLKIRTKDGKYLFTKKELEKKYKRSLRNRFDPEVLKEDVSFPVVSIIEEHAVNLPGIEIETNIRREYPYGNLAFHMLGYTSRISRNSFKKLKPSGYLKNDMIGKMGIEKQYEKLLRGKYGQEYVEVNALGKEIGIIKEMPRKEPIPGCDLYLTLDLDLQLVAEKAFPDSLKGAVVVIDPRNGDVLAMLSSPSPDPNLFTFSSKKRSKLWAKVITDPRLLLNNRAINGTYPPGSTFKMVTALTGLELGYIKSHSKFSTPCTGSFRFGRRSFGCWLKSGHGRLDVIESIMRSCDIYFYQLGLETGIDNINNFAERLCFGNKTGICLDGEKSGLLQNKEKYNRQFKKRGWIWTKGMILNLSIGQGELVTPIQLAEYIAGLGNGKYIYRPRILKDIKNSICPDKPDTSVKVLKKLNFREENIKVIQKALYNVVNVRGGTGRAARINNFYVGGKTGSAENPHGELTHALFVACAPVDNPCIAISVVVENAGHGGSVAAPIAGKILRAYYKKYKDNIPESQKDFLTISKGGNK